MVFQVFGGWRQKCRGPNGLRPQGWVSQRGKNSVVLSVRWGLKVLEPRSRARRGPGPWSSEVQFEGVRGKGC